MAVFNVEITEVLKQRVGAMALTAEINFSMSVSLTSMSNASIPP